VTASSDQTIPILEPHCRELFEYWRSLRAETAPHPPLRERFDVLDLDRAALPWIFVHEVEGDDRPSRRYRCRLAGTGVVATVKMDPTGQYMDAMMLPDLYAQRVQRFHACVDRAEPIYYRTHLAMEGREFIPLSRILLPFSEIAGGPVRFIYSVLIFGAPQQIDDTFRGGNELLCFAYTQDDWAPLPLLGEA